MRNTTDHIVEGDSANHQVDVFVHDEPGHGNACHNYSMSFQNDGTRTAQDILFQNGPIKEVGMNGVTHEAMMAILIDRFRGFQSGQYACRENAIVLTHLEESMMWMQARTRARIRRGVEGTHAK